MLIRDQKGAYREFGSLWFRLERLGLATRIAEP
jgi:hypothetical protein